MPLFLTEIEVVLSKNQIFTDSVHRICHTYGKSCRDLILMRNGKIFRPPDAIVYPESSKHVEVIVQAAHKNNVVLIPFGGGTNVVGAIEPERNEKRMVVTIDLRRMNRILQVDKTSMTARIEVGIVGPDLERGLREHGVSLGHDPDSFEYSTLGGWIAARSSGMQSDEYGDIEALVASLKIVTPGVGVIETNNVPRAACGPDLNSILVGSEGIFGIITEAVMKVHAVPPVQHFYGMMCPNFQTGVEVLRECVHRKLKPSMMRLYDPEETRFALSAGTKKSFIEGVFSGVIKKYMELYKRYKMDEICLAILGFEGEEERVLQSESSVFKVFEDKGCLNLGQSPGKSWFEKRYDLPLMRDFLLDSGLWVEVAETSVTWSNVVNMWTQGRKAIIDTANKLKIPIWVVCHISHTYHNGVCLYFHFCSYQDDQGKYWLTLKNAISQAIVKNQGALSHHHGVGSDHRAYLENYYSPSQVSLIRATKDQLDPKNICNPNKIIPSSPEEIKTLETVAPSESVMRTYRSKL
eukprot:TRINITY_DN4335_c0_g1_i1.p1 TRINITY_DN4335_c0_g1~~TRINITY_DN4335_c0_g1_i1.p1  ORF type:complete len:522 (-),score=95.32 TRINITY_DN4335_c0_g1_i1:7-1572(-)